MELLKSKIQNLYIIKYKQLKDNRGFFERLFCKDFLTSNGINKNIVQINHSCTMKKGSVRGMHYQIPPKAEMKFVKCLKGEVFDVAIDLRKNSSTFLKWHAEILSENNNTMLVIPEGFAHGFQTLQDNTELLYFHTEFFDIEAERSIRYNDPIVNITWPIKISDLSEKDKRITLLDNKFEGIEL